MNIHCNFICIPSSAVLFETIHGNENTNDDEITNLIRHKNSDHVKQCHIIILDITKTSITTTNYTVGVIPDPIMRILQQKMHNDTVVTVKTINNSCEFNVTNMCDNKKDVMSTFHIQPHTIQSSRIERELKLSDQLDRPQSSTS